MQLLAALVLFRGTGATALKSAEFTRVSAQPELFRTVAVLVVNADAGLPSEQLAAP